MGGGDRSSKNSPKEKFSLSILDHMSNHSGQGEGNQRMGLANLGQVSTLKPITVDREAGVRKKIAPRGGDRVCSACVWGKQAYIPHAVAEIFFKKRAVPTRPDG